MTEPSEGNSSSGIKPKISINLKFNKNINLGAAPETSQQDAIIKGLQQKIEIEKQNSAHMASKVTPESMGASNTSQQQPLPQTRSSSTGNAANNQHLNTKSGITDWNKSRQQMQNRSFTEDLYNFDDNFITTADLDAEDPYEEIVRNVERSALQQSQRAAPAQVLPEMPSNLFQTNFQPKRKLEGYTNDLPPVEHKTLVSESKRQRGSVDRKEKVIECDRFELEKPVYYLSTLDRPEIRSSTDPIIRSWIKRWPWQKLKSDASYLLSSSYSETDLRIFLNSINSGKITWVRVSVKGYPQNATVDDVLLSVVRSTLMKLVPCFVEFTPTECKFLLKENNGKLFKAWSETDFKIKFDSKILLTLVVSNFPDVAFGIEETLNEWLSLSKTYVPGVKRLDLSNFLASDRKFLMYFPLNSPTNVRILINNTRPLFEWDELKEINLSSNKLTTISNFKLDEMCPNVKKLDLSNNEIPKLSVLRHMHGYSLTSLKLEGNPLCWNHRDSEEYIRLCRMLFPVLKSLDDIDISKKTVPEALRNYVCDFNEAPLLVDKFISIYFPLVDSLKDRAHIEDLYHANATFSMTCDVAMKREEQYKELRAFYGSCLNKTKFSPEHGITEGARKIAEKILRWPQTIHEPNSFNVDVMYHCESTTLVIVSGVFKVPMKSLVCEEPIVRFMRTFVLTALDNQPFHKISNDLFHIEPIHPSEAPLYFLKEKKPLEVNLKQETAPSEELKEELIRFFNKITKASRKTAEMCLEMRSWDLREALQHFITLDA